MRTVCTWTVALTGTSGHLVTVEADITPGLPATILTGLPDTALRETRDRIRAAILNSGEHWPHSKITVSLYPVSLPKRGSASDLAIAIAILAATGDLPELRDNLTFLAELGLDGRLRPVPGVLPAVLAAAKSGLDTVVVATGNHAEASLVPDVTVIAAGSLADVVTWLRGGPAPQPQLPGPADDSPAPAQPKPDLADVLGQAEARQAAEICAAGGHHLSLVGPPETGKTMLAERLTTIVPALDTAAALEVTSIQSLAGMLRPKAGLVTVPPFCAPHRTASMAAIVGGGSGVIRPGAVSLAHRGILFLDQAPEFHPDVLDALRQPLESGEVEICRAGTKAVFPARFTLVLAADPCPCAKTAGPGRAACSCSPAARRRYLARLSGPLLNRIDVKVRLQPASRTGMLRDRKAAESSSVVAQRVAAARERATARLAGTAWKLNAEVPATALHRSFQPRPGALTSLDQAIEAGQVSTRGTAAIIRVAWTLADLAGKDRPDSGDINQALALRLGTAWLPAPGPRMRGARHDHSERMVISPPAPRLLRSEAAGRLVGSSSIRRPTHDLRH